MAERDTSTDIQVACAKCKTVYVTATDYHRRGCPRCSYMMIVPVEPEPAAGEDRTEWWMHRGFD